MYSNVSRPSSTASLERRTLKTTSCESDCCLGLRRSARLSISQTPSYSTDNTTSHNLVEHRQIWMKGIYLGPVNKQGYSRRSEIFKATKAIKAKEKEMVAKAIAKKK